MEKIVSVHTKWNVPLYSARLVDPEKGTNSNNNTKEITEFLQEIIDFFNNKEVNIADRLITIQNKDNYESFSPKEMMLFYFYYLKEVASTCKKEWLKKEYGGK
ncbi:hypothetical protein ACFO3D_07190 [Virgibacillus kekensis]|uniref:Uncharacterized protein n=1 Tax=Virgibacillus kekensis TaxID=202261 RepID=A0ABV9DIN7_9BACI